MAVPRRSVQSPRPRRFNLGPVLQVQYVTNSHSQNDFPLNVIEGDGNGPADLSTCGKLLCKIYPGRWSRRMIMMICKKRIKNAPIAYVTLN